MDYALSHTSPVTQPLHYQSLRQSAISYPSRQEGDEELETDPRKLGDWRPGIRDQGRTNNALPLTPVPDT